MPEADFQAYWQLGYILGGIVVVAVAALLITILLVARKISSLAEAALEIAGRIEERTRPIWALGEANSVTTDITSTVRRIEAEAVGIADALAPAPSLPGAAP